MVPLRVVLALMALWLVTVMFPEHLSKDLALFVTGFFLAVGLSEGPLFSIARHLAGFGAGKQQLYGLTHRLLALRAPDSTWLNLGFWANTQDFTTACQELARLTAEAVELGPNDSLLGMTRGIFYSFATSLPLKCCALFGNFILL